MNTSTYLSAMMREPDGTDLRTGDPDAVYAYALDGTVLHCMTEDLLDTWWRGLTPAEKAEAWEHSLAIDDDAEAAMAALQHPLNTVFAVVASEPPTHAKGKLMRSLSIVLLATLCGVAIAQRPAPQPMPVKIPAPVLDKDLRMQLDAAVMKLGLIHDNFAAQEAQQAAPFTAERDRLLAEIAKRYPGYHYEFNLRESSLVADPQSAVQGANNAKPR